MPFTAEEFHDLVRLVEEHPEWRAELRRLVLTNEMLALPEQIAALQVRSEQQFQALVETQQRTEARLDTLTVQVTALAEAQQRTEARLDALAEAQQRTEARLDALAEAQQRTEARLDALVEVQQHMGARLDALTVQVIALVEAQQRTEARLDALVEVQQHMGARLDALTVQVTALTHAVQGLTDDVGELKGINLEMDYRFKGPAYFSRMLRRAHVLTSDEVMTIIADAVDRGILSEVEGDDLSEADLVLRGQRVEDRTEAYLVVEVSWGVGPYDVERAARRASLLALTGVTTLPVVVGKRVTAEARRLAHQQQVWQLIDRRVVSPGAEED